MAINYQGFVKTVHKAKTGEVFVVEEYLGIKSSKHKYRIRFAVNGKVKVVDYSQIKNNAVTFSFTKPRGKPKPKSKPKTALLDKNKIELCGNVGIFALDLATSKTGYAVFHNVNYIESGIISKSNKDKFIRINDMLNEVMFRIKQHKVDVVVIEDIFLSGHNNVGVTSYKALSNIQGAIVDRLIAEGYKYHLTMPNEWRSVFFKGKHNREQSKIMAIEYVRDVMGMEVSSDEAEAILIGMSHLKKYCKID
jgi:Holliday junction resolvasome RuvABC endonuclease subunit